MVIVEDLNILFPDQKGFYHNVVKNLSFNVGREKLAIIGGSGSGKSLTSRTLLGLVSKTWYSKGKEDFCF